MTAVDRVRFASRICVEIEAACETSDDCVVLIVACIAASGAAVWCCGSQWKWKWNAIGEKNIWKIYELMSRMCETIRKAVAQTGKAVKNMSTR